MVMGPGENAGAVDVGGGLACAFKVESHNHPSAVEPFQGAATGVGGILRDVFAVGARPIAVLDSLRFGEPTSERSRYLLDRAVAGIGHYGNSIGVPTVGGEVYFEGPYEANCLINAMCVGLAPQRAADPQRRGGRRQRRRAHGRVDRARRDRRGVGAGLRRARRGRRVQAPVACRSATRSRRRSSWSAAWSCWTASCWSSLQDLGAAGPDLLGGRDGEQGRGGDRRSTSSAGAAARGRAWSRSRSWSPSPRSGCSPWSRPSGSTRCSRCASAGRCGATAIGEVTDGRRLRVLDGDELVGDMPVRALVDECPLYDLEPDGAAARRSTRRRPAPERARTRSPDLLALLGSPNLASRRPLFEQYDWIVQSRTVRRPEEADAAVLALPGGGGDRRRHRRQRAPRGVPIPSAAPPRRSTSARPTSPASAPSRSA